MLAAASLALAGCGRPAQTPAQAEADETSPENAFLAPPSLEDARRQGTELMLAGSAPAGAAVRLASPDGRNLTATAGADGRWSLVVAQPPAPLMFGLAAQTGERRVPAQGAVILLPQPGPPAVVARAGFAAQLLGGPGKGPAIAALDFDGGGGAAVAGFAQPKARVRLSFDGAAAGLSQADEHGRFAVIAANQPLRAGERRLQVETETGRAEAVVRVSPPANLGPEAYRAMRLDGAWRIDWAPAGGGVQTTVVFDRAEAGRAS